MPMGETPIINQLPHIEMTGNLSQIALHKMGVEDPTGKTIGSRLIIAINNTTTRGIIGDHPKDGETKEDPPMNIGRIGIHHTKTMDQEEGARRMNMDMGKEEVPNKEINTTMNGARYRYTIIMLH